MKRLVAAAALVAALVAAVLLFSRRDQHEREDTSAVAAPAYVDSSECASCHPTIYETFRHTGMGRSFQRPTAENRVEDYTTKNTFYQAASDRYYVMLERGGRYFQQRYQLGPDGQRSNVVEKEIHYILGSGNHSRTYLHLDAQKRLIELPVGWYSEKGGYWSMNPGYDRRDHLDFRRKITLECIFCHNAYPEMGKDAGRIGSEALFTGKIPEGIDCQRCHGPGRDHIRAAEAQDSTLEMVRNAIVNPGRLSSERNLEVCMQCHLQSTSFRLPNSVRRAERSLFSYRPGQPLGDYIIHFDHAAGGGHENKFEIVNQAYRLRKSACFINSNGAMTCTTCHNPHDIPRAQQATGHYASVCQTCHASGIAKLTAERKHPVSTDCVSCHMPKRRTEDVVHAVMTDHYIQRTKPARDLLAPMAERHDEAGSATKAQATAYKGEVALYYPPDLPLADKELYLGVAQVKQNSNLKEGIRQLSAALEKHQPTQGEFYFEMAEAYWEDGRPDLAIPMYQKALRLPDFWPALYKLGLAYSRTGQLPLAAEFLERASKRSVDSAVLNDLALVHRRMGKINEAVDYLKRAIALDPEYPLAANNLGGMLRETGDFRGAEEAYRQAIRAQPDFAAAHTNLANLLSEHANFSEAQYHFEKAIEQDPSYLEARLEYSRALMRKEMYSKAQAQLELALPLSPDHPEVHHALGDVLALQGRIDQALIRYTDALRIDPKFAPAHFSVGLVLAGQGKSREALASFRKAAESPDLAVRQAALQAIQRLTRQ
ncbi:MAG TPA: tetratricopeptide repeat protein [Terriglobia bacterium]|nr:tetratricopeptide repeat protein [Terriglobia bacterium]